MYDTIIIGSGPAGLTAAIYAARAGFDAVVAEKDYMGTGQIAASDNVDNYPGIPECGGYELGEKFRSHAKMCGAKFIDGEAVSVIRENGFFRVEFKDGRIVESRTVIYAAGTSYRRLDVPGAELLGVSYCAVCDGAFYSGQETAVIGGGDTALEDAVYLSKTAKKVYLICRRDKFRANRRLCEQVRSISVIEPVMNTVLTKINGSQRVEGIELLKENREKILLPDVKGVFAAIGSVPNTAPLNGLCELDDSGYIKAGEECATNVPGLFAAGDVRSKSLRQVITAASDGAQSVNSAVKFLG